MGWRPIPGYNGKYWVDDLGRVASYWARPLIPTILPNGHCRLGLYEDERRKYCRVHHLVAEAFIPNPKGKKEIWHKDGDRENNAADNLEWVTRAEMRQRLSDRGMVLHRGARGTVKLNSYQVRRIRWLYAQGDFTYKELGILFHVSPGQIGTIIRRETWKHI